MILLTLALNNCTKLHNISAIQYGMNFNYLFKTVYLHCIFSKQGDKVKSGMQIKMKKKNFKAKK